MNTPGYYGAASNLYGPDPRSAYYNPLLAFSPPPGGNMSGGGSPSLYDQYQMAYDRARKENLERYQDILGGYAERYRRGTRNLEQEGDYERQDIKAAHRQYRGQLRGNLVNRGLTGTTVAPTMMQGAIRNENRDVGALNDRMSQRRRALEAGLSGDMLSFMERRTDSYPDLNQLINLQMMAGRAGAGTAPINPGYQDVPNVGGQWMPYGGGFNPFVMAANMWANQPRGSRPRKNTKAGGFGSGPMTGGAMGAWTT